MSESQVIKKHKKRIETLFQDKTRLMLTITELKQEVRHLNYKLEGLTKYVCVLSFGVDNIDTILSVGKPTKNMKYLDIMVDHPP